MRSIHTDKYFKSLVIRRYNKVAVLAVFGLVVTALLILGVRGFISVEPEVVYEQNVPTEHAEAALGKSEPLRLRIPSVGIDAPFEESLGVSSNYEIEVPESYETVGWYKHGPSPGELGPAVVLGHVDSYEGPAVLYSLGQVKVGETIEIDREDGTTAVFVVESLERHEQSGFPTAKVYSDLDYPGLRLITCTGTYDKGIQRYSHNLIVFARLLEGKTQEEPGTGE